MSNKNNIPELNLSKFINSLSAPSHQKNFFDLTEEIYLKEEERPGYKLEQDPGYEERDVSYGQELKKQVTDEFIPKTGKAIRRLTSSIWREADKDLARDSNSIKQGVERIKGTDINLFFLRKYFSMYCRVCYRSLTATEGQSFQRPVYTDPGIYCIDYVIEKTIKLWTEKYSEEIKSLLISAENKENSKDLKKEILEFTFTNFIDTMNSLGVVSDANLMVSDAQKNDLANQISSYKLDDRFTAEYLIGGCVLLFDPVYNIYQIKQNTQGFLSEQIIKPILVDAASDVFSGDLKSTNFSSFLNYAVPRDLTLKALANNQKFKKSWYAYTANLTFDPYAEKSYDDFWKKQPFKSFYPGTPSDAKDFKYYEMGTTVAAALGGAYVAESLALKAVDKLERIKKKAKKGKKNPTTRAIFVSSALLSAGIYSYVDPQGFFTIKKQTAVTIAKMVEEHQKAFWQYREEFEKANKSEEKTTTIDYSAFEQFEKDFESAAEELILQLDSTMRTVLGHAMEDKEINMVTKNRLAQVFSSLIEIVHLNFHPSTFSFKIKGKGAEDTVSDSEIYDKMSELRDTVAALQVLEKLVNGEYGTTEKAKKLKKSELSNLNHLSKKAINLANPEIMSDLFDMSDQIRLNRSLFFGTVLRAPDYEKGPSQRDESKSYPSELSSNLLIKERDSVNLAERGSGNFPSVSAAASDVKSIKAEIDFWVPKIELVFGPNAAAALQEFQDTDDVVVTEHTRSQDIEMSLKSNIVPSLKSAKNKMKDTSSETISRCVSEFNEWYRLSFHEISPKLYNSDEELSSGFADKNRRLKKHLEYGIMNSKYFRKQPGLKSRAGQRFVATKGEASGSGLFRYLFILIGPIGNTSHTLMFLKDPVEAIDEMKNASQYRLKANGKLTPANKRDYKNGYSIVGLEQLLKLNLFKGFNDEVKNQFFERFKKTREILINMNNTYAKHKVEPPTTVNTLRDADLKKIKAQIEKNPDAFDENDKAILLNSESIYTRFHLLNNYLESLGLALAWSWVLSKYSIQNFNKVRLVEQAAARLHQIGRGAGEYQDLESEVDEYWSSIRENGSSIIASVDYGAESFQMLNSLFSRYQMKFYNFMNPKKWWSSGG